MRDLHLRFDSERAALGALAPLGMVTDGQGVFTERFAVDVIGEIPGHTGYHANLRILADDFDTSALAAFEVRPLNPARVWA